MSLAGITLYLTPSRCPLVQYVSSQGPALIPLLQMMLARHLTDADLAAKQLENMHSISYFWVCFQCVKNLRTPVVYMLI